MSGGGGLGRSVIPIDDTHFLFVVGDVSGRGVEAATIMARLHFAIRAYAVQGDSPGEILGKLGRLLSIEHDRSFATVLCGLVDVTGHSIALVNAGHPPPLVLNGKSGHFIETSVFPPVGAQNSTPYEAVTVTVPEKATLVAFTDISGRGLQIVSALADEWGVIRGRRCPARRCGPPSPCDPVGVTVPPPVTTTGPSPAGTVGGAAIAPDRRAPTPPCWR